MAGALTLWIAVTVAGLDIWKGRWTTVLRGRAGLIAAPAPHTCLPLLWIVAACLAQWFGCFCVATTLFSAGDVARCRTLGCGSGLLNISNVSASA